MKPKLYLFIALLACLALPLAAAAQESAPPDVSAPDAADFIPDEPNDTFATATPFGGDKVYDRTLGTFLTANDVDYYVLHLDSLPKYWHVFYISPDANAHPVQRVQAALYDATYNLVAEDNTCELEGVRFYPEALGLTPGDYFVRVWPCPGPVNVDVSYEIDASSATFPYAPNESEPNDSLATATPVEFAGYVTGAWTPASDWVCDEDWFRFEARAGDVAHLNFGGSLAMGAIHDANGVALTTRVLPADGTYYLHVYGYSETSSPPCYYDEYAFTLGESLWVSAAVNSLGGNAAIKQGDIVTRKSAANDWAIVFDASDVGIIKDVVAFESMPNGSLLLSLGAAQTVPGLGKVTPWDIIRFVPVSLGANTAGTFEWYLDGSDVGLTTTGEKIDGLYWREDSWADAPLAISITGNGSVPRQSGGNLAVADEDVINFVVNQLGANSAGKWRMSFDGSTRPGMAAEDIVALERIDTWPDDASFRLMVLGSTFNLGGLKGGPMDVLGLEADGPAPFRLTDKPIDGLAVGPAWTE
jgi:hypothetical protein